jgi:hypothetical protein
VIQYMETQGLLHPWGKELATDLLEGVWFSKALVGLKGECNTPSLGHETPNPFPSTMAKVSMSYLQPNTNWTTSQFYAVCSGHWYNNANTEFSAMKDLHQPKYFKTTSKENIGIMTCPLPLLVFWFRLKFLGYCSMIVLISTIIYLPFLCLSDALTSLQ